MAITARRLTRSEAMPAMPDPLRARHPLRTAEKVYRSSQPGKATRFRAVGLCSFGPALRRMGCDLCLTGRGIGFASSSVAHGARGNLRRIYDMHGHHHTDRGLGRPVRGARQTRLGNPETAVGELEEIWCGGERRHVTRRALLSPPSRAPRRAGAKRRKTQAGGPHRTRRGLLHRPASPYVRSRAQAAHRTNGRGFGPAHHHQRRTELGVCFLGGDRRDISGVCAARSSVVPARLV